MKNRNIEKAYDWYREHPDEVEKLLNTTQAKMAFKPDYDEEEKPEKWKAGSWKWLFDYLNIH